jgi:heme oxygenase (biliverdin-producing, ferredoxin)
MSFSLADELRVQTRQLHHEAERAGVMRALLRGEIDRATYCALLRNLYPIYAALEDGLARHEAHPALSQVRLAGLERGPFLAADLVALHGIGWRDLVVLPAAQQYATHLRELDRTEPLHLAAHAYVRYLGDLSGGQILRRLVVEGLGVDPVSGTRFYDFGSPDAVKSLAQRFRAGLDRMGFDRDGAAPIVAEAQLGFALHARLFEQLAREPDPTPT